jgi:hypothetical protein
LSAKVAFALAVIPASLLILASCDVNARSGEGSQAADARAVAEQTTNHRIVEEPVSSRGAVARAGDARARAGDGAVARAGDAVARAGAGAVARAGDIEARANDDSEHPSRKVTLEIRGERGTRFSGTCSIGGEDRRFGGRVPESYSYELGGKKLECEIRKDGPGTLEVVLAAGDDVRSVHRQTGAGSGIIIRLTYSGDGASGVSSSQSQVSSTLDSSTQSR